MGGASQSVERLILPPVTAEFISGVRQSITSVPPDEMSVAAVSLIFRQEAATRTGGPPYRDFQCWDMISWVSRPGVTAEIDQVIQFIGKVQAHLRADDLGLVTLLF